MNKILPIFSLIVLAASITVLWQSKMKLSASPNTNQLVDMKLAEKIQKHKDTVKSDIQQSLIDSSAIQLASERHLLVLEKAHTQKVSPKFKKMLEGMGVDTTNYNPENFEQLLTPLGKEIEALN